MRPLNPEGSLFLYGAEKIRLTYLRNRLAGEGGGLLVFVGTQVCVHLCARGGEGLSARGRGPWGLVSTAQLSASPTEKDEFNIPDLTDNSRRQLVRTKSKRRLFFRVSDEQRLLQRRCARDAMAGRGLQPRGAGSHPRERGSRPGAGGSWRLRPPPL